jgi:hypothetical protein
MPTTTATPTATATPSPTPTPFIGGKLALKPKSINFGKVRVGSKSKTHTVHIRNAGTVLLTGAVQMPAATFPVQSGAGQFSVSPKGSRSVTIQFVPTVAGSAKSTIQITSSDPKHRTVTVNLKGIGN